MALDVAASASSSGNAGWQTSATRVESTGSVVRGLLRLARPRQWVKNGLVVIAPGAAGLLFQPHILLLSLGAAGVFCLAASGTYAINDFVDAESDRAHPIKCSRPIAAGEVPATLALIVGIAAVVSAVTAAWLLAGARLGLVVTIYVAVTCAYSFRLKHEPVIELAVVSAGFVLRAVAGGVATNVSLSDWFLIVASFGSLLVVAGKRSAEHADLGDRRAEHRPTLALYPATFLRSVRILSASVTVAAYCLWAFQRSQQLSVGHHPIWFELSILPVVLAVLSVELRFESGHGAAPEDLALHDRSLQCYAVLWVLLFAVGIYG